MTLIQPNMPASIPRANAGEFPEWVEEKTAGYVDTVPHLGTTNGVTDAYLITTSETIGINQKFTVKFNAASTATPTLNINAAGAFPIKKANGNYPQLFASYYTLFWDGSVFTLLGEGGEDATDFGEVQAGDVLSGVTFVNGGGFQAGTMPNRTGETAALSSSVSGTSLKLLPSDGYRDGVDDLVTIDDPDFIPQNIKSGVNLFGKLGTFEGVDTATGTAASFNEGQYYKITVTGLPFTPSFVVANGLGGSKAFISKLNVDSGVPLNNYIYYEPDGNQALAGTTTQGTWEGDFQMYSDGFTMILFRWGFAGDENANFKWYASE